MLQFVDLIRSSSTKASTPSDNVWTQHLSQVRMFLLSQSYKGIEEEKKKQEEKELEEKKKQEEKEVYCTRGKPIALQKEDMQKYSALLKPKKRRAQAK